MKHERNLGVTEARLGLSVLICLLLVVGYVLLQQLGGTGDVLPVEFRNNVITPSAARHEEVLSHENAQPQVLPIESGDRAADIPLTTQRPGDLQTDGHNFAR